MSTRLREILFSGGSRGRMRGSIDLLFCFFDLTNTVPFLMNIIIVSLSVTLSHPHQSTGH